MRIIRKIYIGVNLKDSMVYSVGQSVISGSHVIHEIRKDIDGDTYVRVISPDKEVYVWKAFNKNVPTSIEYSIDF